MGWSAVLASPYNSTTANVFALRDDQRARLEGTYAYEWGIDAPQAPAVIASNTLTGLTGDYNAVYTYCRKERHVLVCESNPSDEASAVVALTNDGLSVTVAAPEDPQINAIRIYRTTAGGTSYYFTGELSYVNLFWTCTQDFEEDTSYFAGLPYRFTTEDTAHNAEATYIWELVYERYTLTDEITRPTTPADNDLVFEDDNADTVLGSLAPSDHDRPPQGSFVFGPSQNGTLFILHNHQCHYNKPQQPEYWPSTYYVDVSSLQYPLVCGCFYDRAPYLFDRRTIYYLAGTQFADLPNMTTYRPYPQEARAGALSAGGIASVLGLGIFHIGMDGIYRFMPSAESGLDEKITDTVDSIFRGETLQGIPSVGDLSYAWLQWFGDKLYFGYPSGSDTYAKNVLVFDFTRKRIAFYEYPTAMSVVCHDKYYNRFLASGAAGNMMQLEDATAQADDSVQIAWEIETKEFVLQTRKHYPRWNKYDVDASGAVVAEANSYLNQGSIKTHTITGDRVTRRRLLPISNGNRFAVRLSGSGPVKIYAIESE